MAFRNIRKMILAVALVANEQPRFSSVCALGRRGGVDTTNNSDENKLCQICSTSSEAVADADVETGTVPVEGNEEISTKMIECPICCELKESATMHKCSTCKETSVCEDCLEASVQSSRERKCPYCREENTYSFDGVQHVYEEVVSQMNRKKYFRFAIVMIIGVFFQAIEFAFMVLNFKQIVNPETCDSTAMRNFPSNRKCGLWSCAHMSQESRACYCGPELENARQACATGKIPMVMVRFGLIVFIVLVQRFSYQIIVNNENPFAFVQNLLRRLCVGSPSTNMSSAPTAQVAETEFDVENQTDGPGQDGDVPEVGRPEDVEEVVVSEQP